MIALKVAIELSREKLMEEKKFGMDIPEQLAEQK